MASQNHNHVYNIKPCVRDIKKPPQRRDLKGLK